MASWRRRSRWTPRGRFFRQTRVERRGRQFTMVKFRMRPVREALGLGAGQRRPHHPVGRVLRKFRLDELPQFFNILAGHMNLVAPARIPR